MVMEVSATLVATITFRRGPGRTAASCCAGGRLPCRGRISGTSAPRPRRASRALIVRLISYWPGMKTSTSPSGSRATSPATARLACSQTGICSGPG